MSKIVVDLREDEPDKPAAGTPGFGHYAEPPRRSRLVKVLLVLAGLLAFAVAAAAIGGFVYWQYLKTTPQYSLALLVEAARQDDQEAMAEVVDVDAVVEDFVPQVVDKAVELYGRGLPPAVVRAAVKLAAPIMPVVKQRAKAELPNLIREKTGKFEDIPFWAIAVGAHRYLDIRREGDRAWVKSRMADRPLEVVMKRRGDRWQIVAVRDERLARRIAGKIGQEILGLARKRGTDELEKAGKDLGIEDVNDLIKKAEDIFN